ncbi:putative PurR-regulated permease PerM [Flavobacterium cutihirudinis]|uniref:Putative PurR-regulated permease PerM n=1 Tax=Flavobacterium cutihirudinis TaxID=1265740 RepID=A0A3D9FST3_9FLAO|nr:AI-2E family transporter [Flavobacterium cutihirudinis]RED23693.1 putative PurR-regulated permease PerM [Flavobacterium cutihirudinis]
MENSNLNKRKELFETILQLFFIFLIVGFCFTLLLPFFMPILWAIILAVIFYPFFNFLQKKLKGRKSLASIIITVTIVGLMIVPVVYFLGSAINNFVELKSSFDAGTLKVPPPGESIRDWPIVGKPLYDFLHLLSVDLQDGMVKYEVQIKELSKKVMESVLSSGMAFLQFILSVIIAGILLVSTDARNLVVKFLRKIAGNKAEEIEVITVSTIHQVVKGILGVAVIQTIIQAFGLYMADVPYAGLLTLICLIFSILQIGPIIINIGVIIYLFSAGDSGPAIFWTVFFIISGLSDNVLKPLLLGKGALVPMIVIFLGVIGGFIMSGFIGLFVGPIIFSIGYKLFTAWLDDNPAVEKIETVEIIE